jgi:predicted RecB family endonuclease
MSDKIMLNFRCPSSVLEAIDDLGKERYPANTKHRCDRSKTLMEIVQAGIEALSDGSAVLPAAIEVRQQPDDVRQQLSDSLEKRITEIIERKTEPLRAELEDLKTSQAGAIEQVKAELRVELGELTA